MINYNDHKESNSKEPGPNTELYRNLYNHLFTYGLRTFSQTVLKVILDLYGDGQLDLSLTTSIIRAHAALSVTLKQGEEPKRDSNAQGPKLIFNKKT